MRAERRDANEPDIIAAFEGQQCSVWQLCKDEPADLLVLINGALHHRLRLIEVKDPSKPPSARKLTAKQKKTHGVWPVHLVETELHVFEICASARGRIPRPREVA